MTSEEFWQGMDSERVHAELADVRAALDWAASSDPVLACEIFVSVEQLWVTGLLDEGRGRLEVLLEVARDLPPPLRARLHRCHGSIIILHGERERGEEAYRHAIELFHELGDEYNEVALRARFAVHAGSRGDADEARRIVAEVRERNARIGNPVVEPQMLSALGDLAYHEHDLTSAQELYSRSVEAARASGFMLWEMWQSLAVVEMELALDKLEEAESRGQHALMLARQLQDHDCTIFSLTLLALAALRRGDAERAGILWGAVSEAERERPPVRSWDEELVPLAPLVDSTDPRFLAGVAEGRLLSLEHAAAVALGDAEVAQTVP
jgi:tetratricopeptide (TPR) repeat protein